MDRREAARPARIEQPRCPFCHEDIAPASEQLACNACRAWHHQDCWREGAGCSACRAGATGLEQPDPRPPNSPFVAAYQTLLITSFVLGMIAAVALTFAVDGGRYAILMSLPGGALALWIAIFALCRSTGMSLAELRRALGEKAKRPPHTDSKGEGG